MKITKKQLKRIISEVISPEPEIPGDPRYQPREESDERDELILALKDKFGLRHIRTTEEFNGTPGGLWLSAEEGTAAPGSDMPLFDYYIDMDPYVFGVHPEFEAFVIDKFGFAPEWNDPGTLMFWPL